MKIKEEIYQTEWKNIPGPSSYNHEQVIPALEALFDLKDESRRNTVYNLVLSAIGNNHAGAYYPAAIIALKYIHFVAINGVTEVSRRCALKIITSLLFFAPHADDHTPWDHELELKMYATIFSMEADLTLVVSSAYESSQNRALAQDLLDDFVEFRSSGASQK